MSETEPTTAVVARTLSPVIPGIADAIRVRGDLVLVSGQVGLGPDGSVPADFETETDACFANLAAALGRAGCTMADVVRLTYYVTDLPSRSVPAIRTIRDRWVDPAAPPASALVGVAALFRPDVRIEIDAIAAVPGQRPVG